jgi:uncharacterized membrane protein YeaQ/YmgE (transglycosylase-associated protein family)
VAALVLLMLGKDPGVSQAMSGHAPSMQSLGLDPQALLARDGILLPVLLLLLALFLSRGYLFSMGGILPLAAIGILLMQRDFRLPEISADPVRGSMLWVGGAALLLFFGFRLLGRRPWAMGYYPSVPLSVRISQQMAALKTLLKPVSGALAGVVALLMFTNPGFIEEVVPGWRLTLGLGSLLVALFGLACSLPEKIRAYLVPAYWGVVVLLLAISLWKDPSSVNESRLTSQVSDDLEVEHF